MAATSCLSHLAEQRTPACLVIFRPGIPDPFRGADESDSRPSEKDFQLRQREGVSCEIFKPVNFRPIFDGTDALGYFVHLHNVIIDITRMLPLSYSYVSYSCKNHTFPTIVVIS